MLFKRRPDSGTPRRQLRATMSEDAYQRLVALKAKTEADDFAEVIRNALELYEAMIKLHEDKVDLFKRLPDGGYEPFKPFIED